MLTLLRCVCIDSFRFSGWVLGLLDTVGTAPFFNQGRPSMPSDAMSVFS